MNDMKSRRSRKVAVLGPNSGAVKLLAPDGFAQQSTIDLAGSASKGMFASVPGLGVGPSPRTWDSRWPMAASFGARAWRRSTPSTNTAGTAHNKMTGMAALLWMFVISPMCRP